MKRILAKGILPALIVGCVVLLAGCTCEHEWVSANCVTPKTCRLCAATEGQTLEHNWKEATCTEAKICAGCGKTEGDALGHNWKEATCTEAKTCVECGKIEGDALDHAVTDWSVTTAASCSQEGLQSGICTMCGTTVSKSIAVSAHTPGEWKVTEAPTSAKDGTKTRACSTCGEVLETEKVELSAAEKESLFKNECASYSYNKLARNPDDYLLQKVKFTGEVIQVIEDGDEYVLRVNVTKGKYTWSDTIYVEYEKNSADESRILDDDIITFYGYFAGTVTYETIFGASVTIPAVLAEYVEIK